MALRKDRELLDVHKLSERDLPLPLCFASAQIE
jgi:hypothetical protein